MIALTVISLSIAAFAAGFLMGFIFGGNGKGKSGAAVRFTTDEARINREYRNFLTYDGTVQNA